MKKSIIFPFALFLVFSFSCTSDMPDEEAVNPLEGVWELISGEYNISDSIINFPSPDFPDWKSMKIFTKEYFNTAGMGAAPIQDFWSFTGTYEINGNEYTQSNIYSSYGNIGNRITMKFNIVGDTLKQESDSHKEVWKRLE